MLNESVQQSSTALSAPSDGVLESIREYWSKHVHDLEIARSPLGSREFFSELEEYRFNKLEYLPNIVDFAAYKGKYLLEVGCGVGIDLVRFARHGAVATGVDLAEVAVGLARKNAELNNVTTTIQAMDGEHLVFSDRTFDVVYAHGVLQYTKDPSKMIREIYRVLKPGGEAILMVYNGYSWLNIMSKLFRVKLEHEDAPVLTKYSIGEFRRMLGPFSHVEIIPERFPVRSRLHGGFKGRLYNNVFVRAFNLVPRAVVRRFGWHLIAKAIR